LDLEQWTDRKLRLFPQILLHILSYPHPQEGIKSEESPEPGWKGICRLWNNSWHL